MSSSDVVTTIMQMIGSDFVEVMVIIAGTSAIAWVIMALVHFTIDPLLGR